MKSLKEKIIMHIDIDSFFVSAELILRPELKGKDIAISSHTKSNSIVSSLSYSAKFKGAKVPMKLYEVRRYCPQIIVLKPNFNLYTTLSNNIYNFLFKNYSKEIEINSIDEWFLDVSNLVQKQYQGNPYLLAQEIQNKIKKEFKLEVSIGISYNKFLAKMATDLNKPFGITITTKNNLDQNLKSLDIASYVGIGKKTEQILREHGIQTINDLANVDPTKPWIRKLFKNKLEVYLNNAKGITVDDKINVKKNDLISIGNITTFENGPTNDSLQIYDQIQQLSLTVKRRLEQRLKYACSISIMIKYSKEKTSTTSIKVIEPLKTEQDIYYQAIKLFKKIWDDQEIIAIGVYVSNLISVYDSYINSTIFDYHPSKESKPNIVRQIINDVNSKIGKKITYSLDEYCRDKSITKNHSKYIDK